MEIVWLLYFVVVSLTSWIIYLIFWKPLDIRWNKNIVFVSDKEAEKGPIKRYANGWYALTETYKIEKNQCFDVQCCGFQLVVWRGSSGKIYVGDAFCPHLGAHLGIGGIVKDECVECPFHGWKFSGLNGKCIEIPYCDTIPSQASIKIHHTLESNGFIYFWYHALSEKPTWFPIEIEEITNGDLIYRGRAEFSLNCYLQDVIENFGDTSHLRQVHNPSYFRGSSLEGYNWFDKITRQEWSGDFSITFESSDKHIGKLKLLIKHYLFGFCILQTNSNGTIEGPALTRYHFDIPGGKAILFIQVIPKSRANDCTMIQTFYTSKKMPMFLSKLAFLAEIVQIGRDVLIWNRKKHLKCDLLAKQDNSLKSLKKWYKQYYSLNGPNITLDY